MPRSKKARAPTAAASVKVDRIDPDTAGWREPPGDAPTPRLSPIFDDKAEVATPESQRATAKVRKSLEKLEEYYSPWLVLDAALAAVGLIAVARGNDMFNSAQLRGLADGLTESRRQVARLRDECEGAPW